MIKQNIECEEKWRQAVSVLFRFSEWILNVERESLEMLHQRLGPAIQSPVWLSPSRLDGLTPREIVHEGPERL